MSGPATNSLLAAIQANDAPAVARVLAEYPEVKARLDEALPGAGFGQTALMAAVHQDNREIIDLLLYWTTRGGRHGCRRFCWSAAPSSRSTTPSDWAGWTMFAGSCRRILARSTRGAATDSCRCTSPRPSRWRNT
jgi:hypothetical protein